MSLKISSEKINNPFLVDLLEKSVKGDKENNQNNFYNIYSIRIETKSSALVRCSMGSVADSSAAKIRLLFDSSNYFLLNLLANMDFNAASQRLVRFFFASTTFSLFKSRFAIFKVFRYA